MLEKELDVAVALAKEAGRAILEIYEEGFEVERKTIQGSFSEPVTKADKESSRIIVEGLSLEFPADAFLSEEEPDDTERRLGSRRVWIIDPLDGTQGFTEKMGDFAVQIGLVEDGKPVLGIVYQPIGSRMFHAVKDLGAYVSEEESEPERMTVSDTEDFSEMTIAVSRSHRSPKMNRVFEHFGFESEFRHGSVGLKVGFVACRSADIYIHLSPHTKFWDTAAPQIILEESGGRFSDIFGGRIDYTLADVQNHNGILCSNSAAWRRSVDHLRPLLTEFGRARALKKK